MVAFDLSATFDQPRMLSEFEHSMVSLGGAMRLSPAPNLFVRPSVGLGAAWFFDTGDAALDLNGLGLQLVAALDYRHGNLDLGLHYTLEAQTIPVYDPITESSVLESRGLRHVVMLRTGVRF